MPVWICAADGHTWGWVSAEKRQVRNKDEESLALVEECVMKYAAGGCFDCERCDLCDYGCNDSHVPPHQPHQDKKEKGISRKRGAAAAYSPRVRDC